MPTVSIFYYFSGDSPHESERCGRGPLGSYSAQRYRPVRLADHGPASGHPHVCRHFEVRFGFRTTETAFTARLFAEPIQVGSHTTRTALNRQRPIYFSSASTRNILAKREL